MWKALVLFIILTGLTGSISRASEATQTWATSVVEVCKKVQALPSNDERTQMVSHLCKKLKEQFPIEWDWALQDSDGLLEQWIGEPFPVHPRSWSLELWRL